MLTGQALPSVPHSNSPNNSEHPRMVQIVTMFPADAHSVHKTGVLSGEPVSMEEERRRRVESWRHGVSTAPQACMRHLPGREAKLQASYLYL